MAIDLYFLPFSHLFGGAAAAQLQWRLPVSCVLLINTNTRGVPPTVRTRESAPFLNSFIHSFIIYDPQINRRERTAAGGAFGWGELTTCTAGGNVYKKERTAFSVHFEYL